MKHKKTHLTETLKNIAHDPKEALRDDYEQTKADMKNVKDGLTDTATSAKTYTNKRTSKKR
jgi:hypothetical protein